MIQPVKVGGAFGEDVIRQLRERSGEKDQRVEAAVAEIVENVRTGGDRAVREYTVKFDGKVL